MTEPTVITAAVITPRDQPAILRWLAELDVDADDCLAMVHQPGDSPYAPGELIFTFYDRDGEGEMYADSDGTLATYQRRRDFEGELPPWWTRLAEKVST